MHNPPASNPGSVLIGRQVGKYRIVEYLGEGAMAQVFAGEDPHLGRKVAIKVILAEHCHKDQLVNRFVNEAKALGRINHPGVVAVIDVARLEDGRVCLIMEHLQGQDLFKFLHSHGRLSFAQALPIMLQLADTLAAAHDQKIIHRDLKPENIFVVSDLMGALRIKVLDFGIAKLIEGAGSVATVTKTQMGTAAYMPPEQFKSSRDVDHRSDIYALGCVFFELLGGRPPFLAQTLVEHMRAHAFEQAPLLSSLVGQVPAGIDDLLGRMLAKERDARPTSMREVKAALEAIRDGKPVPAPVAAPVEPASAEASAGKRTGMIIAVVVTIVVVAACAAVVALS